MAGRARGRHRRRDGPREPTIGPAGEGTGRTLRDSAPADGRPRGRLGSQGEPPPGTNGVCMEVKPGSRQTEIGVIPEPWEVTPVNRIGTPVRGGSPLPARDHTFFICSHFPIITLPP